MPIDDETAKKIEKDWLVNQAVDPIAAHNDQGVPMGFKRLYWLGAKNFASVWWFFVCGIAGFGLATLSLFAILEGTLGADSALMGIVLGLGGLCGAAAGFVIGRRLDRRSLGKSKGTHDDEKT